MQSNINIYNIQNFDDFITGTLQVFRFQAQNNPVYKQFITYLNIDPLKVNQIEKIPFLPVQFFKDYKVISSPPPYEAVFQSSGTTGMIRSKHYIKSLAMYEESFTRTFRQFYGDIKDYTILALLPSYLEQGASSLVYMVDKLIEKTGNKNSGFYLHNHEELARKLQTLDNKGEKILLIGVSYALLDVAEKYRFELKNTIVMETGGMKGRRKEMLREELHEHLKKAFGVPHIHSEYGMTELLSQAYSKGEGIFNTPAWMKILIRDTEDPLTYLPEGKTGGVNIIDLANIYSCSFIATQDLGKITSSSGSFEILGRFDNSDVRGCNLLVV